MQPTLNGVCPSWAEIDTTINVFGGQTVKAVDYKSIDWDSSIKRGDQRGASGGRVLKRTTGEKTDTASASFYRSGLRDLKRQLMAVAPKDDAGRPMLSKVSFDVIIKHSYPEDSDIFVVKLLGCKLDKNSGKHSEGTNPDMVDVDLNPLEIVEVIDGVDTVLL